MNTALLVLPVVPGILLIGHGLQKLVPPKYSPPLLHAMGHWSVASRFEQLGIRPGLPAALLAGIAEILGGFSLAAGLLTPLGTILTGAVMTAAILTVHARNGIWNHEGGFEFPLLLLAASFVITALGPGSYSINDGPASPTGRAFTGRSANPPAPGSFWRSASLPAF
jgi:putative oxidoreductase